MYLNSACFDSGLIVPVHELLHTLGFVHEHNRTLVLAGSWFCYKPFWSCSKRLAMILEAQANPLDTILRESKRSQHNKACTGQDKEPFCLKVTKPINFIPLPRWNVNINIEGLKYHKFVFHKYLAGVKNRLIVKYFWTCSAIDEFEVLSFISLKP